MNTTPLSEPLVQRLAWTLIHFLWQGFAITLLLALAVRLGRVRRSDWRYCFSLVALLSMTASPMATFMILNVPTSTEQPVQHSLAATTQSAVPHAIPDENSIPTHYAAAVSNPDLAPVTEPATTPSAAAQATDSQPDVPRLPLKSNQHTWQQLQPWIVSVWICGVALLSSRLLIGWLGVRQIRRRGIAAPGWLVEQTQRLAGDLQMACPELNLSHRVQEAIALGFLRPMILLPAAWVTQMPPDMLEAVLAHELAHIRRHDLWINLFQRIVETLLFYHPAVWWLSRRLRIERELCCDELVVRVTQNPLRYAETLEHIGRLSLASRSAPLIVSIMGSRSMLSVRIRNILRLQPQQQSSWAWLAGAIPLLLAGAVYWSMAAGTTTSAQAEDDQSDESIVSVKFSGNNFHPEADLAKHVKTRPGTDITPKQIKDDVDALIRTRWFSHVEPVIHNTDEGLVLTYKVTERPLISSVEYKGNKKISTEALSKLTQLKLNQPFDVSANCECVRRIQEMYKEKGFAFVTVELARGDLQRDPDRDIIFQIDEGPKVKVSKVEFEDLRSRDATFPEDKKREKTRILWLHVGKYSGDDHSEWLRHYYHCLGYFDVEITPHDDVTADKSKVAAKYRIDEGPRYRINDISIAGNEVFTQDQIMALIKVQPGQEYNQRQIIKDVEAIQEKYGTTGRFFTKINPIRNFPEEPGIVDLVYQIEEKQPRISTSPLRYHGAAAKESRVQVGPFGRIEGEIFIDPHARKAGFQPDSLRLVFRSIKSMREFSRLEDGAGRQPSSEDRATVNVDANGKFSVDSLAAGYLTIESSLTSDSPFALIVPAVARVQTGQTLKLVLEVTTQATCHGFVRKRGTNEPISGATVCLEQPTRSTTRNRQQRVKTDSAGRYEATLLSGPVKIRLETRVEGFSTVHAWESPHFHAGTSLYYKVPGERNSDELPALELVPLERQTGKLLDQLGEPASEHWEVLGYSSGIWAQFSGRAQVQEKGEFHIQFPAPYPPQVFGARRIVKGSGRQQDGPTHQLIIVSQHPLILKLDGKAWPPHDHPTEDKSHANVGRAKSNSLSQQESAEATSTLAPGQSTDSPGPLEERHEPHPVDTSTRSTSPNPWDNWQDDTIQYNAEVAAMVNGKPLLKGEVLDRYTSYLLQIRQQPSKIRTPSEYVKLREQFVQKELARIIQRRITIDYGNSHLPADVIKSLHREIDHRFETEIDKLIRELKVTTRKEMEDLLLDRGTTLEAVRRQHSNERFEISAVQLLMPEPTPISQDDIAAYYNSHSEEFTQVAAVTWDEIQVSFKTIDEKDAAHRQIKRARRELEEGGSFAIVAQKYSDGMTALKGGRWEKMEAGTLKDERLEQSLFEMSLDTLSEIHEGTAQFRFVIVRDRQKGGLAALEEVAQQIRSKFERDQNMKSTEKLFRKMLAEAVVETKYEWPRSTPAE